MPIYMDIHEVPGAQALDLAEAHSKDLLIQEKYSCKCMTYWLDEARGNAFCLIEAPDKSVVEQMHSHSHGFIPHKIIEVKNEVVESFLGRIRDPEDADFSDKGLKVFSESAFRVLLFLETIDPAIVKHKLGLQKVNDLFKKIAGILRQESLTNGGRQAEHTGSGYIVSFSSAANAISTALGIDKSLTAAEKKWAGIRIGIHAGNPVQKSEKVFGDTIQKARWLCEVLRGSGKIMVSSLVKNLLKDDDFCKNKNRLYSLSPQDEMLMEAIWIKLEEKGRDSAFTVTGFCQSLSMSKSRLYRKTMSLWELSPNLLLKEFRLNKAIELLKGQCNNISQVAFETGFTSPSYFTKCFKKRFGMLPAMYQQSL